jgi:hypothetical protein
LPLTVESDLPDENAFGPVELLANRDVNPLSAEGAYGLVSTL